MSVGAVSGVGAGASGAAGAMSPAAAAPTAVAGPVVGESNPVTSIAQLEVNGTAQADFNSIDLLLMLLLLAAGKGKDDDKSNASAGLGVLLGLALAGELGRMDFQFQISGTVNIPAAETGGASGGALDVSA